MILILGSAFDGIIIGFGLPYLSKEEGLEHFRTVFDSLKNDGSITTDVVIVYEKSFF